MVVDWPPLRWPPLRSVLLVVWPPLRSGLSVACRQVVCLFILNWAAPGCFRSKTQKWQKEVLGRALASMPGALGVLLSPVYYHKRGNLWACEQALLQMLSSENINTDRMAAMLFKGRRDERDSRPVAQCCGEVWCCARSLWCIAAPCGGGGCGGAVWGRCANQRYVKGSLCGAVWWRSVWCSAVWCGVVQHGVVQCIVARGGALLCGVVCVVWSAVQCDAVWCCPVLCCAAWCGVLCCLVRRGGVGGGFRVGGV